MAMTLVWILGWTGISVVLGSFFELPLKTVALVGATLGPLGFIVVIAIGVIESSALQIDANPDDRDSWPTPEVNLEDPFL